MGRWQYVYHGQVIGIWPAFLSRRIQPKLHDVAIGRLHCVAIGSLLVVGDQTVELAPTLRLPKS